jgi:hypothetical protein
MLFGPAYVYRHVALLYAGMQGLGGRNSVELLWRSA